MPNQYSALHRCPILRCSGDYRTGIGRFPYDVRPGPVRYISNYQLSLWMPEDYRKMALRESCDACAIPLRCPYDSRTITGEQAFLAAGAFISILFEHRKAPLRCPADHRGIPGRAPLKSNRFIPITTISRKVALRESYDAWQIPARRPEDNRPDIVRLLVVTNT